MMRITALVFPGGLDNDGARTVSKRRGRSMKIRSRILLITASASAAVVIIAGAVAAAPRVVSTSRVASAVAADAQPSLVEDYSYPGADAIKATYGVALVSGDGHIMFADCATSTSGNLGLIQVHTSQAVGAGQQGLICFKVLAVPGHLEMKVPAVYEIRGDGLAAGAGHHVTADLTTDDGTHTTVAVNPSGSTPVGIGNGPANQPTTLLTLSATS
ncbi:hypothetical protein [Amycolatopsis pigmentata]|uniref:Uncharacterized protein n=1 Tax=Amycolatopsis pigmentata TaxID=450801 RepID=A0ABW5G4P5_9PSEU